MTDRPADRLHLSPRHRAQLEALLREHLPDVEVWAYGSRITGESHDGSDLDLVLRAPDLQEIPIGRLSDLWEALRESTIPFLVEARDWARLPAGFHGEIERDYVVLVEETKQHDDNGWLTTTLGDVITLKRGYDLSRHERVDGSVPVVSSSGIIDYHSDGKVSGPGVVTGRYGTLGQVFFIPNDFWPLNTALYVQDFKGNDPRFIAYFLRTLDFSAYSDKAAVPGLNRNHLHQESVRIPTSVSEQRAIAYVLGALDDKIELNRRMNETLEAMARALFQSWFVDFDPVRAKMEGRDTGLPKNVADLFPDRLANSELGDVPAGWAIKTLGDLLELAYGKALKADERNGGNVPVHGSNGKIGWHDQWLVQGPGIVVGRKGNPGTVTWVASDFFPIDTTFYVVPKYGSDALLLFLFHTLKNQNLASVAADSAVPGLNRNLAYMNKAIVPSEGIIEHFNQYMNPFFVRNHILQSESCKLTDLRDRLLPELITGRLSATDVNMYQPVV